MKVAVVMGSISDMPVMQQAIDILHEFGVETHIDIVSAHRTPEKLVNFSTNAHTNGINVIIAGAGGAAHLPGMVASMSPLPVIGVPVKSSNSIDGWDSVLSILQMPGGVPVATVQILASQNAELLVKMIAYKQRLKETVLKAAENLKR
jgi:5-(carboxyamino)imidazole ribonucleotide mutase